MESRWLRGAATLLLVDLLWVGLVMRHRYALLVRRIRGGRERGASMARRIAWTGAVAYSAMVIGLVAFCIDVPRSPPRAAARGALFGAVVFATYDFTLASLFDEVRIVPDALVEVAMGSLVYAVASAAGAT